LITIRIEGDITLDPSCGSETTCIAAIMLKWDFSGLESSAECQQIALKRLERCRWKMAAL